MTDLAIRTVPWSTKITSKSNFTDTNWGWHIGTNIIRDKHTNIGSASSTNFSTNGITWHRQSVGEAYGSCQGMFTDDGFTSHILNAKNYNSVHFFGTYTNSDSFRNDTFTYPTDSNSCFVRNVIGFAVITELAGSFSDGGGDAQGYLEKLCFFYMHPDTRVRHTYQCKEKIAGDVNMNSKLSNKDEHWFSYRLNDSDMAQVTDNKLLLMGIGLQFFHGSKTKTHTSENKLKQFRPLVSTTGGWNNPGNHSILYCLPNVHKYSERNDPQTYDLQ